MSERIFYCMKYHKLVNGKELQKCLARFTYYNKDGKTITCICPRLYDLLENKAYFRVVFDNISKTKKSSVHAVISVRNGFCSTIPKIKSDLDRENLQGSSDYWTRKNKEFSEMILKLKNADPSDIFKAKNENVYTSTPLLHPCSDKNC